MVSPPTAAAPTVPTPGKVPVSIVAAQVAPGPLDEHVPVAPGQTRLWNDPAAPEVAGYFDRVATGSALLGQAGDALINEIVTGRHRGIAAVDTGTLHAVEQVAARAAATLEGAERLRTVGGAPVWDHAALDVAQAIENVRLGREALVEGIDGIEARQRQGSAEATLPERNHLLGMLGIAESQFRGGQYVADEAPRTHDDWVGDHYTKMATTPTMATLWPESR